MEWDPIGVNRVVPWTTRLYILLLLFVAILAFIKALHLAWRLGSFRNANRVSSRGVQEAYLQPNQLANLALANRFDKGVFSQEFRSPKDYGANNANIHLLHSADLYFRYLWQLCFDDVNAMRRSISLTLLASGFLVLERLADLLRWTSALKYVSFAATAEPLAEICVPVASGVGLCVLIYLFCMRFEGMLALRKARWNYFYAAMKEGATSTARVLVEKE